MTIKEFYEEALKDIGIPVFYQAPKQKTEPPFVCYIETASDNFFADGLVYERIRTIDIELYTRHKDPETEELVERALARAGIPYNRNETWIEDEKCIQIVYGIEV